MGIPYAEVIGDPIAQSKSPIIHNFWLEQLGIEGDYRATRVAADELPAFLAARRADPDWRGCNLTLPLKEVALAFVDERRDAGVGATNCIVQVNGRLVALNTDTSGLDLAWPGIDQGAPVAIIGAGGAAKAALRSLDVFAACRFNLIVREPGRAEQLVMDHGDHARLFTFSEAAQALQGSAGIVNASPLGMRGFPEMPETVLSSLGCMGKNAFALDMVYSPPETEFLRRARRAGLQAIDGFTMLIGQAAHAFHYFFGASAPREHDAALRERLTS